MLTVLLQLLSSILDHLDCRPLHYPPFPDAEKAPGLAIYILSSGDGEGPPQRKRTCTSQLTAPEILLRI